MAEMAPSAELSASSEALAPGAEAALAATGDPLAALRACGAAHADPVRFRFLEALARRVQAQQGAARRFLETRLAQAIDDCAGRFAQVQGDARAALAAAAARHPDAAAGLQQLFDAGDFAALRRRCAALARQQAPTPLAALSALAASVAQHADPADPAGSVPANAHGPQHGSHPAAAGELKSLRYFRDTWAQLSVEQQLTEALAQAPENAGPLNSHRLVLRALEHMRDVSPDYLKRFMAYIDALLWLEQTDGAALPAEKNAVTGDGDRKKSRSAAAAGRLAGC